MSKEIKLQNKKIINQSILGSIQKNQKKEEQKKNQNIKNNPQNNLENIEYEIDNFVPDPDKVKKGRSKTMKATLKKGKLKEKFVDEKINKLDQKRLLKTPQIMVPRLRPKKNLLNPTPLQLNPFSKKTSKANLINEQNIIVSEGENEESKSESSSSSTSSFPSPSSSDMEENENENQNLNGMHEIEEKEENEEDSECKEKIENNEKKEDILNNEEYDKNVNNINNSYHKINVENIGSNHFLSVLYRAINKFASSDKKEFEEELYEDKSNEDESNEDETNKKIEIENQNIEKKRCGIERLSLKEFRKGMIQDKRIFRKRNKSIYIPDLDSHIKENFKKFKEDFFEEEKEKEELENQNKINEAREKCCPILDFYMKNMSLIRKTKI